MVERPGRVSTIMKKDKYNYKFYLGRETPKEFRRDFYVFNYWENVRVNSTKVP